MPKYQKLIIIGAPRSGTNMLRDALCRLDGFETWPCDEINAVWRHGFLDSRFDDFPAERANESSARFVRGWFDRLAASTSAEVVVEKTCANSLRVAYLARLLPEARFIFLYRDGADATTSAAKRWVSKLDVRYTLEKARFVPLSDFPIYGWRFLRNRIGQLFRSDGRLPSWGPMTPEIAEVARTGTIMQASAQQWSDCVTRALNDFETLPADRSIRVTYETFVADPVAGLRDILSFVERDVPEGALGTAVADVRAGQVGRGREELAALPEAEAIAQILDGPLARFGYGTLNSGRSAR